LKVSEKYPTFEEKFEKIFSRTVFDTVKKSSHAVETAEKDYEIQMMMATFSCVGAMMADGEELPRGVRIFFENKKE
jgi:hypothetical protein